MAFSLPGIRRIIPVDVLFNRNNSAYKHVSCLTQLVLKAETQEFPFDEFSKV